MVAKNEIRHADQIKTVDPIWDALNKEARQSAESDPVLAAFLFSTIINHKTLEDCVIYRICERLDHPDLQAVLVAPDFDEMLG